MPVTLVVTISLSTLYLGRQIGDAERRFKDLEKTVTNMSTELKAFGATAAVVAAIRSDVDGLKRRQGEDEAKARQLWFYTHGRIQRMPWHPPQQEE
jgi:hypothetical protein